MSNLGHVRSWWDGNRWGSFPRARPLILAKRTNEHGHVQVALRGLNNQLVHRLMLFAFVGPPPAGKPFGLHENDIPDDNRLENLRWGSAKENRADSRRNGTEHRPRGELSVRAKLTWDLVREIRASSESNVELAARFGVAAPTIGHVRSGRTWKEVA